MRAEKPINSSNRPLHYIGHDLRGHTGYPDGDGDSETRPTAWRLTRLLGGSIRHTFKTDALTSQVAEAVSFIPPANTWQGYRAAFVVRECQVHTLLATCFLETPSMLGTVWTCRQIHHVHGIGTRTVSATKTWPCIWPALEELSGLSWVRLVWKSPDNHIGKCKV